MSEKYFGLSNPLNETIEIKIGEQFKTFKVTALVDDIPNNSSIDFEMLISFENLKNQHSWAKKYWNNWQLSGFPSFVMLKEGQTIDLPVAEGTADPDLEPVLEAPLPEPVMEKGGAEASIEAPVHERPVD